MKDQVFYFGAIEGIREHLLRPNLSEPIGTPCPVSNPTLAANEALINGSADCQRLALINFFKTPRGQDEGQPVAHSINNAALLGKIDWATNHSNNLSVSYNFNSLEERQPDVRRCRPTARRPTAPKDRRRSTCSTLNLFTLAHRDKLNEFHFTLLARDRSALWPPRRHSRRHRRSGSRPSFRFGNPFFMAPNVDELVKRFQMKDNFTIVRGTPHDQDRRRVAAHEQRPGVSRFLRRPLPVRQRHRVPALHLARRARRVRAEHGRLLERRVCHSASDVSRRNHDDAAGRCCSTCRAAAPTASRATRPARRISTTRSSRCSSRTSGRLATD